MEIQKLDYRLESRGITCGFLPGIRKVESRPKRVKQNRITARTAAGGFRVSGLYLFSDVKYRPKLQNHEDCETGNRKTERYKQFSKPFETHRKRKTGNRRQILFFTQAQFGLAICRNSCGC
jgi:hypothetical protein